MRSTFVGDAWVVVFRDQDRNNSFYKEQKRADLPRVYSQLGRPPWCIGECDASPGALPWQSWNKWGQDGTHRAVHWDGVNELELNKAANTWGLHSA
jgi:hypothetical protein